MANQTLKEKFSADKARLNELLEIANNATGAEDANIADAITTLVDGFGQGGSRDIPYLPQGAEFVTSGEQTLNLASDTTFDSVTPTTSATTIRAAGSTRDMVSVEADVDNYEYCIVFYWEVPHVYRQPDIPGSIIKNKATYVYYCSRFPGDISSIVRYTNVVATNVTFRANVTGATLVEQMPNQYGISLSAPTFTPKLSTTTGLAYIGLNIPAITVRANSSMITTEALQLIDSAQTDIILKYTVYRLPKDNGLTYNLYNLYNQ